jgi:hypothetical protein
MPTIQVDVYSVSVSHDVRLARKLYQAELPPDRQLSTKKQNLCVSYKSAQQTRPFKGEKRKKENKLCLHGLYLLRSSIASSTAASSFLRSSLYFLRCASFSSLVSTLLCPWSWQSPPQQSQSPVIWSFTSAPTLQRYTK